jgi:hypothetical protein
MNFSNGGIVIVFSRRCKYGVSANRQVGVRLYCGSHFCLTFGLNPVIFPQVVVAVIGQRYTPFSENLQEQFFDKNATLG